MERWDKERDAIVLEKSMVSSRSSALESRLSKAVSMLLATRTKWGGGLRGRDKCGYQSLKSILQAQHSR